MRLLAAVVREELFREVVAGLVDLVPLGFGVLSAVRAMTFRTRSVLPAVKTETFMPGCNFESSLGLLLSETDDEVESWNVFVFLLFND